MTAKRHKHLRTIATDQSLSLGVRPELHEALDEIARLQRENAALRAEHEAVDEWGREPYGSTPREVIQRLFQIHHAAQAVLDKEGAPCSQD